MASQTLILQNPTLSSIQQPRTLHHHRLANVSTPRFFSSRSIAAPSLSLRLRNANRSAIVASSSTVASDIYQGQAPAPAPAPAPVPSLLTGSTRTITTLAVIVLAVSKVLAHKLVNLGLQFNVQQSLIHSVGPALFASMTSSSALNTPLTVIAAGMAKWLDIYSGVLMIRVMLSWFPNIPWERQPLTAIKDLCDPYLNLFRNIIPPIFDTLDVSPLLAFAVLGFLASVMRSTRLGV